MLVVFNEESQKFKDIGSVAASTLQAQNSIIEAHIEEFKGTDLKPEVALQFVRKESDLLGE